MNTTYTIQHRSLKLLAISCLSLGFGLAQTDAINAQSGFDVGSCWKPLECISSSGTNLIPLIGEQESKSHQLLPLDANSLQELSAQQRAAAARCVKPYLGKQTAWQDYPSAEAVQLPPKQVGSTTDRVVTPLIIRSPFADFSTKIPTIAAANPSQRNAETSFRNGAYAEARSSVGEALRQDPDNGDLLMFAAMTNLAVADYDNAGKLFAAAATVLEVEDWKNVFAMADQLYGNDDAAQHLADFFEFCETTDNVNARRLRGYLAFELQHFETAQRDLDFVINNDADDAVVKRLLSFKGDSPESQSATGEPAAGPQLTPAKATSQPLTN